MTPKKKIAVITCLALLFLFHLINNLVILTNDTTPPLIDSMGHVANSYQFYQDVKAGVFITNYFKGVNLTYVIYPPLYNLSSILLYVFFGFSHDIAVMTNMLYLAILLASLYFIGKKLNNEATGLLAAFIVTLYPAIFGFSRTYIHAFPLSATVSLSICLLLYSDNFKNRLISALFGIACGLSLLIQWTTPIFIAGPALIYFFQSFSLKELFFHKKYKKYMDQLVNLFIASIFFTSLSLLWVAPHLMEFLSVANAIFSAFPDPHLLLPYYFELLPNQLSYLFTGLFIIALLLIILAFFAHRHKILYNLDKNDKNSFLFMLGWCIIPVIIFNIFLMYGHPRWIVPYLPGYAIITAYGFMKIRKTIVRNVSIFLIILLGLSQFFLVSYACPIRQDTLHITEYGLFCARTDNWAVKELVGAVNDTQAKDHISFVLLTNPLPHVVYIELYAKINKVNMTFFDILSQAHHLTGKNVTEEIINYFDSSDYLLVVPASPLGYFGIYQIAHLEMDSMCEQYLPYFKEIANFTIPDYGRVRLYQKNLSGH